MKKAIVLVVASISVFLLSGNSIAGNDWKESLKNSLRSKYELTKFGSDRLRITQPGTVLIVQKDGITGDLATDMTFTVNKVRDGKVAQAGGFAGVLQNKKTSRIFKTGEKIYITKIDVKENEVQYYLMSYDTFDVNVRGSSKQTRYVSLVNFQFPKEFLESADGDKVKKAVDDVIAPEAEVKAASTKSIELGRQRIRSKRLSADRRRS